MYRQSQATRLLPASLLVLLVAGAGLHGCAPVPARTAPEPPTAAPRDSFTFFVIGDPQINVPRWGTAGTEATIDAMNALPGEPFPLGGTVDEPRGVLIAGDLVDDVGNPDNWELYTHLFDPGGYARLRFPVYEVVGNHDLGTELGPGEWTYVQRELIQRNSRRPGHLSFGPNRYHYSWDWGSVHFVSLNVFPGTVPRPVYGKDAPWNDPKGSLAFLRSDLEEHVGASGRPVILMWHYGLRGWGLEKWWTPEDLDALAGVLRPYDVALILHGHEHRYERYGWEGYDVIMAPSPQIDRTEGEAESRPKGFLVVRVEGDRLETAYHGPDGWEDAWSKAMAEGPKPAG